MRSWTECACARPERCRSCRDSAGGVTGSPGVRGSRPCDAAHPRQGPARGCRSLARTTAPPGGWVAVSAADCRPIAFRCSRCVGTHWTIPPMTVMESFAVHLLASPRCEQRGAEPLVHERDMPRPGAKAKRTRIRTTEGLAW